MDRASTVAAIVSPRLGNQGPTELLLRSWSRSGSAHPHAQAVPADRLPTTSDRSGPAPATKGLSPPSLAVAAASGRGCRDGSARSLDNLSRSPCPSAGTQACGHGTPTPPSSGEASRLRFEVWRVRKFIRTRRGRRASARPRSRRSRRGKTCPPPTDQTGSERIPHRQRLLIGWS